MLSPLKSQEKKHFLRTFYTQLFTQVMHIQYFEAQLVRLNLARIDAIIQEKTQIHLLPLLPLYEK